MKVIGGLHGKRHITCAGFTDFGGDNAQHEYDLGLARAQAVCNFFATHGAAKVTRSVSFGGDKPLILTGDHNARSLNRRVEVTFGH
jgi:outer membrane protein OmpA-like peptidoglycan-associated protein